MKLYFDHSYNRLIHSISIQENYCCYDAVSYYTWLNNKKVGNNISLPIYHNTQFLAFTKKIGVNAFNFYKKLKLFSYTEQN